MTATDDAADGGTEAQVNPDGEVAEAVSTKLSAPTPNLMNVFPAPTKISPFV